MSVTVYWLEYHPCDEEKFYLGRAEASWIHNHIGETDEGSGKHYISEEQIQEAMQDAKGCTGCGTFDSKEAMAEHRRLDKEVPRKLRKLLAYVREKTGKEYFDIEVSW
jgi:hypothetical protein